MYPAALKRLAANRHPVPKWRNKAQAIETITRLALQLSIRKKDRQEQVAQAEPGPGWQRPNI